jgi:hypothetical protein
MVASHPGRSGAIRVLSRSSRPPPGFSLVGGGPAVCLSTSLRRRPSVSVARCATVPDLGGATPDRTAAGNRPGLGIVRSHPRGLGGRNAFDEYSPAVWRRAVRGTRGMSHGLATIALVAGNAEVNGRLSVANTEDLVWFLARSAFIFNWMDNDRMDRVETTEVLPVMPICLEVLKMATLGIALGTGVPTKVVWTLTEAIFAPSMRSASPPRGIVCIATSTRTCLQKRRVTRPPSSEGQSHPSKALEGWE